VTFLVAVVSPDSLASEWCQHELALAKTQGIGQRRVKVLPVRFRGAAMPAGAQVERCGLPGEADSGAAAA
jgi:hypothetical protein